MAAYYMNRHEPETGAFCAHSFLMMWKYINSHQEGMFRGVSVAKKHTILSLIFAHQFSCSNQESEVCVRGVRACVAHRRRRRINWSKWQKRFSTCVTQSIYASIHNYPTHCHIPYCWWLMANVDINHRFSDIAYLFASAKPLFNGIHSSNCNWCRL